MAKGKGSQQHRRSVTRVPSKQKQLSQKPDEHVECRTYRAHALKPKGFFHFRTPKGRGICLVSVCMRCGTQTEDYCGPNMVRMEPRKYVYPDNYLLEGDGKLTQDMARQELVRRASEIYASADDLPRSRPRLRAVSSGD